MRTISTALALVLVAAGALSLGSVAAGSGHGSSATRVVFSVTGKAPKGASVSYGRDTESGTLTYVGKFPFHKTLPIFDSSWAYSVSAQLKHGGKITCKLTIGKTTKVGHAKGGHHRCHAKLTRDGIGADGWH